MKTLTRIAAALAVCATVALIAGCGAEATGPQPTPQQFLDRDRPCRLRVQEGTLEMEPEAERIDGRGDLARGEQVAGDARADEPFGVVHLEVDEAGKDERFARVELSPLDGGDAIALDRERARVDPLNRVNDNSL